MCCMDMKLTRKVVNTSLKSTQWYFLPLMLSKNCEPSCGSITSRTRRAAHSYSGSRPEAPANKNKQQTRANIKNDLTKNGHTAHSLLFVANTEANTCHSSIRDPLHLLESTQAQERQQHDDTDKHNTNNKHNFRKNQMSKRDLGLYRNTNHHLLLFPWPSQKTCGSVDNCLCQHKGSHPPPCAQ